tara:strand:+ start:383 stop:1426 length:1044 start_codon:yes stop_codon:yes gene_type:complete
MDNLFLEEFSDPVNNSDVKEILINQTRNNIFQINNTELDVVDDYDINTEAIIHKKDNLSEEVNNEKIYDISRLFNREIKYKNIIISNIEHTNHDKSSNKLVYNLYDKYSNTHVFKNIIGFRLSEFIMNLPSVNLINQLKIYLSNGESEELFFTIESGLYTINTFISVLNTQFDANGSGTFTFDPQKMRVKWNCKKIFPTDKQYINFHNNNDNNNNNNKLLNILGYNKNDSNMKGVGLNLNDSKSATHPPNLLLGSYIDIVIEEIPSDACKHVCMGKDVIARIPIKVDGESDIIYYDNRRFNCNYESNNLFYPKNIDKLSISLFIDNYPLPYSNIDYSFDFELTILNR